MINKIPREDAARVRSIRPNKVLCCVKLKKEQHSRAISHIQAQQDPSP